MAGNKTLLKKDGNTLCLSCHADIGALIRAKNVHPPAEESWLSCHDAHAAEHPPNLTEDPAVLCLTCHDGGEAAFQTAHYKMDPKKLRCAECHNPHGSDAAKMLNAYAHAPFAEKECDTCHAAGAGGVGIALVEKDVSRICLACHDDKAAESRKGRNPARGPLGPLVGSAHDTTSSRIRGRGVSCRRGGGSGGSDGTA